MSPRLCSPFELSWTAEHHLFLWEVEECWPLGRSYPLKLFLWTVISEDFANLAVFVHQCRCGFFQKVRFCLIEEGDLNRSEVSANATALAKLSNKEIYKKWLLGWA
jgi:hypothetical protein